MDFYSSVPDLKESQFDSDKVGLFIINDIRLYVPPTSISVHKEGLEYSFKSLRTRVSTKIASGNGVLHAQVKLTFPKEGILQLHRLICQIRNNPFVIVENKFLADSMNNVYGVNPVERKLCNFTVMGLQISNHPSSPGAFLCELDLRKFNPAPYTKVFGFKQDYLVEEYNGSESKFFTHKVFPNIKGEYESKGVLVKTISAKTNSSGVKRVERFVSKDLSPISNKILVSSPTKSNAYKRYSNYLQIKALFEDFEIFLTSDEEEKNDDYIISVNSSLKEKLEKGDKDGVLGLHEIGTKSVLNQDLLLLRDEIIKKMFQKSEEIRFGFKEFKKLSGSSGFLNRFGSSLNHNTKGLNKSDRVEKRKANYKKIIKAIRGEAASSAGSSSEGFKNKVSRFLQVNRKERDIASAKNLKGYGSELKFYPLVTDGLYTKNNVQSLSKNNGGLGYDKVAIVFAPFDCDVNFSAAKSRTLVLTSKEYNLTLQGKDLRIPPELINLYKSEYAAKVKKGDILGFLEGDGFLNVVSNAGKNTYSEMFEFYKEDYKTKIKKNGNSSSKVDTPFIFDLLIEDIKSIDENDEALREEGFAYNYSRPGASVVAEKIIIETFDSAKLLDKNNLKNELEKLPKSNVITGCTATLRNLVSSIPILGLEAPTHQFLGSIEPTYQFSVLGVTSEGGVPVGIRFLEYIRNKSIFNAKNFNFIPDSHNIFVDCFITKLIGSQKAKNVDITERDRREIEVKVKNNFSINSMDTFTIEGSPGVSGLNFRISESKSFYDEEMAPVRTNELNVNPTKEVIRQLAIGATSNIGTNAPELITNSYKEDGKTADYSYLAWETTNFTAKQWYSKATPSGKRAKNKIDPEVDKRAFLWCRDFLEPLQALLKEGYDNNNTFFTLSPVIHFKYGGTFDSAVNTKRDSRSNHFANVASDIYVPGMNAKHLAALVVWAIDRSYFDLSSLRGDSFYKNTSTEKYKQLNIGMGIYGKTAYGDSVNDLSIKMDGDNKDTGFVHIDANFLVRDTNKFNPKTISPGVRPRRWVGKSGSAAFRVNELNENESLRRFWFTDIRNIINHLGLSDVVIVEESDILEDETDSTEPDNTQGNKQENIKNTYVLTKREDVLDMLKIAEVFKNIKKESISLENISIKSYSELSAYDQLKYGESKKDYQFIVIRSSNISNALKDNKKFNEVKSYLNDNYNLNIKNKADLIKNYSSKNPGNYFYSEIRIPISRQARSYNLQKVEKQKELKRVSGMLQNFQKLASIVLTEPYLYTDTDEEAVTELKRIEQELNDLQVVPSMFEIGTKLLIDNKGISKATSSQEAFNEGLGAAAIGVELSIQAYALSTITTFTATTVGFPATLAAVGIWGLIVLLEGLGNVSSSLAMQNNRTSWEVNNFLINIEESYKKYIEEIVKRKPVLSQETFIEKNNVTKEDLESEMEAVGKYLADSRSVGSGVNAYIGMVYSSNSIIKYFGDMSKNLKVNSTVNQLLRFSESELKNKEELTEAQKVKGVSLVSEELSNYLVSLLAFPYYKDQTHVWVDIINPDDGYFSEIFEDNQSNGKYPYIADEGDIDEILYEDNSNINQKEFLIKYQTNISNVDKNDPKRKPGNFSERYFKARKEELRRNQDKKIAWLKSLLEEITSNYVALSEDPSSNAIKDARDVFKLFENDAYPDIDRPAIPSSGNIKKLLPPSFYYWDSKDASPIVIDTINKETSESISAILDSSIKFQEDLNSGVVSISNADVVDNVDLKDYTLLKDDSEIKKLFNPNEVENLTIPLTSNNNKNLKKEMEGEKILGSQRGNEKQITEDTKDDLIKLGESAYKNFYRENDMLQAFPTFRLYIIEEDSSVSDKLLVFDDFYYYNSVIGFQYHESREQSASTATIQLQNISGTLDGSKRLARRDIDLDSKAKEKELAEIVKDIDSIVIRNGINVQLRAGYENNTSELDILLSGLVTDVQYTNDNTVCSIVVQSHGVELERSIKGFVAKNNQETYNNGTAELLTNMILSDELKHFGRIKKGRIFPPNQSTDDYFIENFEGREDTTYRHALTKTYLSKIEKYSKYGGYALTALVFLPIGRYILGSAGRKALLSSGGRATRDFLKRTAEVTDNIFKSTPIIGTVYRGGTGTYIGVRNAVNALLSGSRNRASISQKIRSFAPVRASSTSKYEALFGNSMRKAIVNAAGTSRYAAYRVLGRGRVSALWGSLRNTSRTAKEILDDVDTQELIALQQAYLVKELGYGGALNVIGETLAPTTLAGNLATLINPAGIVGKAAGLTVVSMLSAIPVYGIGGIADYFSWISSYEEDLYKLRKRTILSPSDDNIFPPRLDSYYNKEEKESFSGELLTITLNIFKGNIGFTSLFRDALDLTQYSFEELIRNEIKKTNKMIHGDEIEYLIQNQNLWQILHEMSLRHPGYCYAARPYGQGLEYRVFFGLPNYRHFIKPASNYESMRLNKIFPVISEARELTIPEIENLYFEEYKSLLSEAKEENEIKTIISNLAYNEYKKSTKERFVPFRKYHLADSSETLIANNIICSSHNCTNKVIVNFSFKGRRGSKEEIEALDTHDSIYTLPMKASKNIPPELERPKVVSSPNINGIGAANRYGISSLIYGMKSMYEGSLLTLGNPKVRPWDIVMLKDRITNMYGPLEVKAVTHTFNHEVGFLTDIEVNAVVSANDFSSIPMIDQSILYEARKEIFDEFNSRQSFGLSGNEEEDKKIIKARLEETLKEKLKDLNQAGEFSYSSLITPTAGTNAAGSAISGATNALKNSGLNNKEKEGYLKDLTNKLYDLYSDPENRNFYNDVLSDGQVPEELTDDISNLFTILGVTSTGLGGVAYTGRELLNRATGATLRGGSKTAVGLLAVGVITSLGSKLGIFKDGINGISSHYYNRYLKENIVRPQILSKATERSLIKILPLVKDGKPLLAGGIEGVSQDEQWNRVLTNIYNNTSDATEGFLEEKEKLEAAGVNVIKDINYYKYGFTRRVAINIADTSFKVLLGDEAGTQATGYVFGDD